MPKKVRLYLESRGKLLLLSGEVKSGLLGRILVAMWRVLLARVKHKVERLVWGAET